MPLYKVLERTRAALVQSSEIAQSSINTNADSLVAAIRRRQHELTSSVKAVVFQQHSNIDLLMTMLNESAAQMATMVSTQPPLESNSVQVEAYELYCIDAHEDATELLAKARSRRPLLEFQLSHSSQGIDGSFMTWGHVGVFDAASRQQEAKITAAAAPPTVALPHNVAQRADRDVEAHDHSAPVAEQRIFGCESNGSHHISCACQPGVHMPPIQLKPHHSNEKTGLPQEETPEQNYSTNMPTDEMKTTKQQKRRRCGCAWKGRHLSSCSESSILPAAALTTSPTYAPPPFEGEYQRSLEEAAAALLSVCRRTPASTSADSFVALAGAPKTSAVTPEGPPRTSNAISSDRISN